MTELSEKELQQIVSTIRDGYHLFEKRSGDKLALATRELVRPGHIMSILGLVLATSLAAGTAAGIGTGYWRTKDVIDDGRAKVDSAAIAAKKEIDGHHATMKGAIRNGLKELRESSHLPVGSIIPWHETPPAVRIDSRIVGPGKEWRRCNGQRIEDLESPFRGQYLPDLNGALNKDKKPEGWPEGWPLGTRLFLRGGTGSGNYQEDALQDHRHGFLRPLMVEQKTQEILKEGPGLWRTGEAENAITESVSEARKGNESRPVNMSVVWIIRVKGRNEQDGKEDT